MTTNRIHIVGRKNHGKTTLVAELIREFTSRGLSVGTIKHTHHHHELDTPGKDSHVHREAGATAVGILSPLMSAVFLPHDADGIAKENRYALLLPVLTACDLIIVEGDSQTTAPKVEVWRAACQTPPLAKEDDSILAVVTDDDVQIQAPKLSRRDVAALASWIVGQVLP